MAEMDFEWFDNVYRQANSPSALSGRTLTYVEPDLSAPSARSTQRTELSKPRTIPEPLGKIRSTIITLGDMIDTDALAPGPALTTCVTDEEFGEHCLEYTHPEFRSTVKGYTNSTAIVVAGIGFGVGSSRENAVSALKGCGVKCVISRGFAFIFGRNLPSLGLLGFNMTDESFYETAKDGRAIEVDVQRRVVKIEVDGEWREWSFDLSEMEYQLTLNKGITESFKRYGRGVWEGLMQPESSKQTLDEAALLQGIEDNGSNGNLEW